MTLPSDFVNEGLELAKGATFLGVPFESLTRDELLAVAAKGWRLHAEQAALNAQQSVRHMRDLAEVAKRRIGP